MGPSVAWTTNTIMEKNDGLLHESQMTRVDFSLKSKAQTSKRND